MWPLLLPEASLGWRTISAVTDADAYISTSGGVRQHGKRHDSVEGWGKDTFFLHSIWDREWLRYLNVVLDCSQHAIMTLSYNKHAFLEGIRNFTMILKTSSLLTWSKASGQIDIGGL